MSSNYPLVTKKAKEPSYPPGFMRMIDTESVLECRSWSLADSTLIPMLEYKLFSNGVNLFSGINLVKFCQFDFSR